jgi:glycosyltransferase involved in cell wall biosynthesis
MIKVAISQRIIPDYRVPVFKELAKRTGIDLTVYYGDGFETGTEVNALKIEGFKSKKLITLKFPVKLNGTKRLIVLHPTLFFRLLFGNYDIVITEPTTNFINVFSIYIYCKLFGKKYIWHEAGGVRKENRSKKRKVIDPIISSFINNAAAFLTYNSYADEYLINGYNVKPQNIFRAQNALDTSDISQKIVQYSPYISNHEITVKYKDYKKVLFIGALDKRKKVNNLISACAIVNKKYGMKVICIIIGDGPDIDFIKNNCSEEEEQLILFLGKKIEDAVLYILISDIVVLPGQGGLSINHALACGKPIIATEEAYSPYTRAVYDYIEDDINGMVAKTDDIKDLAFKIVNALENEERYKSLCTGAIQKSKDLSIEKMVDGYIFAINYVMKNENSINK